MLTFSELERFVKNELPTAAVVVAEAAKELREQILHIGSGGSSKHAAAAFDAGAAFELFDINSTGATGCACMAPLPTCPSPCATLTLLPLVLPHR